MTELKFSRKQTCTILENYYKEQQDIVGKVNIKATSGYVGYGMDEHIDCVLEMKLKGVMSLGGIDVPVEQNITLEELNNAFTYFLDKTGKTVKEIELDSGLTTKTIGYGLGERDIKTAYFSGVRVTLESKTKTIGGM